MNERHLGVGEAKEGEVDFYIFIINKNKNNN